MKATAVRMGEKWRAVVEAEDGTTLFVCAGGHLVRENAIDCGEQWIAEHQETS